MIVLNDVTPPTAGIRLTQDQVVAYCNEQPIAGEGTLYVSESCVTWTSRSNPSRGISITYKSIVIHAVSTDLSTFPHECLLLVIDAGRSGGRGRGPIPLYTQEEAAAARDIQMAGEELRTGDGEEDEEAESEDGNVVLRFVPADTTALQLMYNEMAECQELNPEDEDIDEDEEEYDDAMEAYEEGGMAAAFASEGALGPSWYTAGSNLEDVQLSEEGAANLQRIMANSERARNGALNGHHEENGKGDGADDGTMEE